MKKILHIASFDGNIGDMANHKGFYDLLNEVVGKDYTIEQLEIRRFYNNSKELQFDESFIDYANKFDIIIFGGGAFLSLEWAYSKNGTTINLGVEDLERIRTPIIFNDVTFKQTVRTTDVMRDNFKKFCEYCINCDNILFTIRNDGSHQRLQECYGKALAQKAIVVPDGGFFVDIPNRIHDEYGNESYMTLNLAADHSFVNVEDNIKKIAQVVEYYLHIREGAMIFVPHIYKDLRCFAELTSYIDEKLLRNSICVAPLLTGKRFDGFHTLDIYREAEVNFGMRFHSNVCAINLGIPTVGFGTQPVVQGVFDELGISYRYIYGETFDVEYAIELLNRVITNRECVLKENKKIYESLYLARKQYKDRLKEFLERS